MKIVSACLAGVKCRYDGEAKPCRKVMELVERGQAIPVCPEQLGGLTTPRTPAEKKGDQVFTRDGKDVTGRFRRGAREARRIARLARCHQAILKAKSPSCGFGEIYDGTFSGRLTKGNGVFAEMLEDDGMKVMTEEEFSAAFETQGSDPLEG
uniref:Uncharacterized conserved protein YbbK, DUF523 family n=1 Tax=Candidatus Kentrum sp. FM TaxID=2126340 RepID=A0A450WVH0_9GAMM|nr:MAG: Uncharacterized conserved protein YbbK, DUF523 family [Candidatus Kentron sp. FM]VFJ73833.1 MAG: Uncharacterized conserved protein YbbK, DUF523 family [Candidatus Kentron sp. FM]VFK21022.1 MAG: Uncharacterized conserved protein YbbK, DUF523 family [Candidatus Kentron sp. FM]